MANEKNLKPLSTKKAREIGKKGGIKSGEVRRERKKLKDELLLLLSNGDTQSRVSRTNSNNKGVNKWTI